MWRWMLIAGCWGFSGLSFAAADPPSPPARPTPKIVDPFVYCTASGTRDMPRALAPNLRGRAAAALGLAPAAANSGGFFWRCMDGAVFVCAVGANILCAAKADRSRTNTGAAAFCREKRTADFVPAYATGHLTIYQWRCAAGAAVRGKEVAPLDRRGYRTDFWHKLAPTDAGG